MKDLQEKNNADLIEYINEQREELRKLRFSASGSGMRNTHAQKNTRREVARALTELNRRAREGIHNNE